MGGFGCGGLNSSEEKPEHIYGLPLQKYKEAYQKLLNYMKDCVRAGEDPLDTIKILIKYASYLEGDRAIFADLDLKLSDLSDDQKVFLIKNVFTDISEEETIDDKVNKD